MQKKVVKHAFWLDNEQRSSRMANQISCFSNQARALDGAIMAQFFLDCVIIKIWARAQNWEESSESVKFKTSFTQIFSCILLIGNHTVLLVQFGINLHLWVFQKAKLHSPKRLVQFQLFEKTHSCKLIPNWTWNRMITYTNRSAENQSRSRILF